MDAHFQKSMPGPATCSPEAQAPAQRRGPFLRSSQSLSPRSTKCLKIKGENKKVGKYLKPRKDMARGRNQLNWGVNRSHQEPALHLRSPGVVIGRPHRDGWGESPPAMAAQPAPRVSPALHVLPLSCSCTPVGQAHA